MYVIEAQLRQRVGSIVIRQYTAQLEFFVQAVVAVMANRGEKTAVSTRSQEVIDKGKSLYAKECVGN